MNEAMLKLIENNTKAMENLANGNVGINPDVKVLGYDWSIQDRLFEFLRAQSFLSDVKVLKDEATGKYYTKMYDYQGTSITAGAADDCCYKVDPAKVCVKRYDFCELCVENCRNSRWDNLITRGSSDITGSVFQAGDSIIDTEEKMLTEQYNFLLRLGAVRGDSNFTVADGIPCFNSLSSVYQTANGVDVISAGTMAPELALMFALSRLRYRNAMPVSGLAGAIFATSEGGYQTFYERAFDTLTGTTRRGFTVNGQKVTYAGIEIVGSRFIYTDPNTALTEGYFIPTEHVGMWLASPTAQVVRDTKENSTVTAGCYTECVKLLNLGGIVARNTASLFRIMDIPTYGGTAMFSGYTNGLNPTHAGLYSN